MKAIYVISNVVVGIAFVPNGQDAIPSGPAGSAEYNVADNDPTKIGWNCTIVNGQPSFSQPAAVYPDLTAMQFYDGFSIGEAIAIKGSKDPTMQEAWFRVQTALNTGTQVSPSVSLALLEYASTVNQNPNSGVGIYLPGALTPVPAWTPGATVAAGASLAVGNTVYTYATAGTTGATAPSGTTGTINDGTATCQYTATPYIQPSRIPQILGGQPAPL